MAKKTLTPEELDAMEAADGKPSLTPGQLDEMERPPPPRKTSRAEAELRGIGQGLTFGFGEELGGVGAVLGDKIATLIHRDVVHRPAGEVYREGRDEIREANDKAAKDRPWQFIGGTLAGAIANPASRLIPGGRGVTGVGAKAAAEGAAFGLGESKADLTRGDFGRALRDTGNSALVGGAVGAAGASIGQAVRRLGAGRAGTLPDRIATEIAEGPSGIRTTPTAARKLERGIDNIYDEVVHGPDADAVRRAYLGSAKDGIPKLQPIIDEVGGKLDEAYGKFEQAGVGQVDAAKHVADLRSAATAAAKAGRANVSAGLEHMAKQFEDMATRAGLDLENKFFKRRAVDLRSLRQFTTDAQTQAAQAIGGLNEGVVKVLKDALAAEQTKLMSRALAGKATTPELQGALATIETNNPRMNALLNIRQALEMRRWRERTTSLLGSAVKGASASGGAAFGFFSSEGDIDKRVQNALLGGIVGAAASKGLPAIWKAGDRYVTTKGIELARSGVDPDVAGPVAGRIGRGVAALVAGSQGRKRRRAEEPQREERP